MTPPTTDLAPLQATFEASDTRPRVKRGPSLVLGRMQRAIGRQAWLFAIAALIVTGAGLLYDLESGAELLAAVLFSAPIGVAGGIVIAALGELSRNTVTTPSSLRRIYDVLGAAPELSARALRELPPDARTPLGCVIGQPAAPFAGACRDLQSALRSDRLVAFIAPLLGEGATTSALCAAVSAAQQGRRVIVVDCDLRQRSLTKALGVDPERGVLECCETPQEWASFVAEESETGLHFLPAARLRNPWRSLLGSQGLLELIEQLREAYDLVVLDCPSALRSSDGAVLAGLANKCIVVTSWDQTPLVALHQAMRALKRRGPKLALYINRVLPGYKFERAPAR